MRQETIVGLVKHEGLGKFTRGGVKDPLQQIQYHPNAIDKASIVPNHFRIALTLGTTQWTFHDFFLRVHVLFLVFFDLTTTITKGSCC